jgi:phosphonate transport system substrate-binding protein
MQNFSLRSLSLVSYLAPNWFYFYKAVEQYLGRTLNLETSLQQSVLSPLEDTVLLGGKWDVALICGLPLVQLHRIKPEQFQPIAAPVMAAERYRYRPIYFADLIVRNQSSLNSFNALEGKVFCFNDSGSNSGYHLIHQHLLRNQKPNPFFRQMLQSGSHQTSIRWVAEGLADCAAIDSTVLEQEFRGYPELKSQVRMIESIGPSPMPPIVAASRLGVDVIAHLRHLLLYPDAELQSVMDRASVKSYAAVAWENYGSIANYLESEAFELAGLTN